MKFTTKNFLAGKKNQVSSNCGSQRKIDPKSERLGTQNTHELDTGREIYTAFYNVTLFIVTDIFQQKLIPLYKRQQGEKIQQHQKVYNHYYTCHKKYDINDLYFKYTGMDICCCCYF